MLNTPGLSEGKDAGRFLVVLDALLAQVGASEAIVIHNIGALRGAVAWGHPHP